MIDSKKTNSTINIKTTKFGDVDVSEDSLIEFISPVIGFDGSLKYALLPHSEDSPFTWLQSVDEPDVSFIIIQAFDFFPEYAPDVDDADLAEIDVKSREDFIIVLLVTIPENFKEMTANLVAPVIINKSNRKARQVIIRNFDKYSTKEKILKD